MKKNSIVRKKNGAYVLEPQIRGAVQTPEAKSAALTSEVVERGRHRAVEVVEIDHRRRVEAAAAAALELQTPAAPELAFEETPPEPEAQPRLERQEPAARNAPEAVAIEKPASAGKKSEGIDNLSLFAFCCLLFFLVFIVTIFVI